MADGKDTYSEHAKGSAASFGFGRLPLPVGGRLLGQQASFGLQLLFHQIGQLPLLGEHGEERADELVVVVRPSTVVHHIFTALVDFVLERALASVDLCLHGLQQRQQVVRCERVLFTKSDNHKAVDFPARCCT